MLCVGLDFYPEREQIVVYQFQVLYGEFGNAFFVKIRAVVTYVYAVKNVRRLPTRHRYNRHIPKLIYATQN